MKFITYLLTLACIVGALTPPRAVPITSAATTAHKFHTSFTEADYNAAEQSLQITLRTFPDDLETILAKRNGKRSVRLDRKEEVAPLLTAYLQETFQLKNAQGETLTLSWVGLDAGVDSAWLYFEAKLPGTCAGATLRNEFLFDLYDDQINLVSIKQGDKKQSLTFKQGDASRPLAPQ